MVHVRRALQTQLKILPDGDEEYPFLDRSPCPYGERCCCDDHFTRYPNLVDEMQAFFRYMRYPDRVPYCPAPEIE